MITWRPGTVPVADSAGSAVRRPLWRVAIVLTWFTAIALSVQSVGEIWRYGLMLRGRTEVLPAGPVRFNDSLVEVTGWTTLVLAVATAVALVPLVVALHDQAARLAGSAPSRSGAAVVARLVIPGWNLYGAGQILAEVDATLVGRYEKDKAKAGVLVRVWALAWLVDGVLVLWTLGRAFGRGPQAIADTVELHAATAVAAAVVAVLTALLAQRWLRLTAPAGGGSELRGWLVQPPSPTSHRGIVSKTAAVEPLAGESMPAESGADGVQDADSDAGGVLDQPADGGGELVGRDA